MKNLTWQNPEQLFVAQELINKVKSKCCGIKACYVVPASTAVASGVHGLWCEAMLLSESNLLVPSSVSCAWHSELAPPSLIINDGVLY